MVFDKIGSFLLALQEIDLVFLAAKNKNGILVSVFKVYYENLNTDFSDL